MNQRIDKWLWFARLAKSRTLAASLVSSGRVRVNREKVSKPSATVKPGDVITASIGRHVRIVKIVAAGTRRGPATEAVGLYEDLTPPAEVAMSHARWRTDTSSVAARAPGSGRPTKRDRRLIDRWRRGTGDD